MRRLIAVRTPHNTYHCAIVKFATEATKKVLEERYYELSAALMMLGQGDLISLDHGPMRAMNHGTCQQGRTLVEVLEYANEEDIHHLSIFDKGDELMSEVGNWNMTCEEGEDLFIENIANMHRWYHLVDCVTAYEGG